MSLSEHDPRLLMQTSRPSHSIWVIPLVLALAHALLMSRLWSGNLFNSYAYVSDDGFDWLAQGLAFNQLVAGHDSTAWPVLRQPLFVLVSALDAAFGSRGAVFLLAQSAAVGLTAYAIMHFTRERRVGSWSALALILAWYFFIFGFYRLWVLSDSIAAALMTCSVVLSIKSFDDLRRIDGDLSLAKGLVPALLATILAGLTQTYGLLPFLAICMVNFSCGVLQRNWLASAASAACAVLAAALVFGGQALWAWMIPHESVPTQFGLLKISPAMASFYLNLWPFILVPLLPALMAGAVSRLRKRTALTPSDVSLVLTTALFATLSFFYQWEESRLTFMYAPILLLAVVAWCCPPTERAASEKPAVLVSSLATLAVGLCIVPGDYWRPSLAGARVSLSDTWFAAALREPTQDRYFLQTQCKGMDDLCQNAAVEEQASPYRSIMFREYKRRMTSAP